VQELTQSRQHCRANGHHQALNAQIREIEDQIAIEGRRVDALEAEAEIEGNVEPRCGTI
jgi:hypothetical protein